MCYRSEKLNYITGKGTDKPGKDWMSPFEKDHYGSTTSVHFLISPSSLSAQKHVGQQNKSMSFFHPLLTSVKKQPWIAVAALPRLRPKKPNPFSKQKSAKRQLSI